MESKAQTAQQKSKDDQEPWIEDSGQEWEEEHVEQEQEPADEEMAVVIDEKEPARESHDSNTERNKGGQKNVFINGLYVGLGIGCIATFITMWIAVFFSPQLPPGATYTTMLSIFIYPLIYLLAVGLVALTAGVVREYYVPKSNR
jgi:hypothetical protein